MTKYTCQKPVLAFSIGSTDYILRNGDPVELDESNSLVKTYVARGFIKASATSEATKSTTSKS